MKTASVFTAEQARLLLSVDDKNLANKLKDGKTLSPAERERISASLADQTVNDPPEIGKHGWSKIARLPNSTREELNHRLLDGEPYQSLCDWLNSLPPCDFKLTFSKPAGKFNRCNLSEWRTSGYAVWLARRKHYEDSKETLNYARTLAQSGNTSIADGGASIASSHAFALLEKLNGSLDADTLNCIVSSLASIRSGEVANKRLKLDAKKIELDEKRIAQQDRALDLEQDKFQRTTCEMFLKWYAKGEARNVIEGDGDNSEKIEQLGKIMFGDLWRGIKE